MVQRVRSARIREGPETLSEMGPGLLALVGVKRGDGLDTARDMARKLVHLRVLSDDAGRMNHSLLDAGGTLGVVSQFTLYGDARKGRRPTFVDAAPGEEAEPLVEALVDAARALGVTVVTGRFGAMMDLELVNAGPVTLLLDSERAF